MASRARLVVKELLTLPFWALGWVTNLIAARPVRRLVHLGRLRASVGWVSPRLQLDGPVTVEGTRRIRFPEVARFGPHVYLETRDGGEIELEENVRLNAGTHIVSYRRVRIGRDTLIGEYVSIRDANHGIAPGESIRSQAHEVRAIDVGRDVWIGRGACILAGVRIGDGAVIGANSVVTKDVESNTIVAGVPATRLRAR